MAESSFPVLEKPLSDQEWKSVTLGIGDGVLDEGGNPYNLTNRSNVSDTATIAVDTKKGYCHAILKGFYHKLDAPMTVQIPPVTAKTTYYISLVYDPLNQNLPVSLQVITSLNRTSGKEYLILWKVERSPNQLLTDAKVTKYRQTVAPNIQVDYFESLPDAQSVLFGTQAHCLYTGDNWRASYDSWRPESIHVISPWGMPGWDLSPAVGGIVANPVKGGYICNFSGPLTRVSESYNIPPTWTSGTSGNTTAGTPIPPAYRPPMNVYGLAISGNNIFEVRITKDGVFQIRSTSGGSVLFTKGAGMSFQLSWFVPWAPTELD